MLMILKFINLVQNFFLYFRIELIKLEIKEIKFYSKICGYCNISNKERKWKDSGIKWDVYFVCLYICFLIFFKVKYVYIL